MSHLYGQRFAIVEGAFKGRRHEHAVEAIASVIGSHSGTHGCPVKSRTDSIGCRSHISHFESFLSEVPVKWGFSRTG
jgi:hypothetical protein